MAFCLLGSAEFGGEREQDEAWQRIVAEIEKLRDEAGRRIYEQQWAESEKLLKQLGRVDPGLVHRCDVDRVSGVTLHPPIKIAVLHHPISPLPYTEVAHFSGTINSGPLKNTLMSNKFSLVLHGHMHTAWFAEEHWPDRHGDWTLRIASAASLGTVEKDELNGFNEILISREGAHCRIAIQQREFGTDWPVGKFIGARTGVRRT